MGLVGESGCGKTTLGRTILKLYHATGGNIIYKGNDITHLPEKMMLPYRKRMQMIFQDPYTSLNPKMTAGAIIGESIDIHQLAAGPDRTKMIRDLLSKVGLRAENASRYPHEFSGGQRQRIGIARALAVQPEFIICDEPISSLDASVQAQIINLLADLQQEMGLTYLFIAHDLAMVKHISDRIGVMYLGKIVELACSNDLYANPLHPYTKALLAATMACGSAFTTNRQEIAPSDGPLDHSNPPRGCCFQSRCDYALALCNQAEPELREYKPGHFISCHRFDKSQ